MTDNFDGPYPGLFVFGEEIGRGLRRCATGGAALGNALDLIGLVPGLNIPAEIASGILSLKQRDYVGFGLSVAGLVPIEGEWAVALKLLRAARQVHDVSRRVAARNTVV